MADPSFSRDIHQGHEQAAKEMLSSGKYSIAQVKAALVERGMDAQNAGVLIKKVQRKLKGKKSFWEKLGKWAMPSFNLGMSKGASDMLIGGLWLVGGLIATFANIGYIFYGAIIFGGIQFIRGLLRSD